MSNVPLDIHGLYVDLIAPCAGDGRFLSREFHVHLRRMARVRDIQGVVVNGPAGEAFALDQDQRAKILQAAVSAAPSGFPVIAAVPAIGPDVERETRAALDAGASGIIVLGGRSRDDDARSLSLAVRVADGAPVLAWNIPAEMISESAGVAAVVLESAGGIDPGRAHSVLLTDRSFDLHAIAGGRADGAVLAAANIAEAIWGRIFRFAKSSPEESQALLSGHVGPLQQVLVDLAGRSDPYDRTPAAAIKHGLFTLTQNTSAATLPPLLDIGDDARDRVSGALTAGRLMPGMA